MRIELTQPAWKASVLPLNYTRNTQVHSKFIVKKIIELESSLKEPIVLMRNKEFPFFDTSVSKKVEFVNSVSLLNIQSINDFQDKIEKNTPVFESQTIGALALKHPLISLSNPTLTVFRP